MTLGEKASQCRKALNRLLSLQSGTLRTCKICVLQGSLGSPQVKIVSLLHNGKNDSAFLVLWGIFGLLLLFCLFACLLFCTQFFSIFYLDIKLENSSAL